MNAQTDIPHLRIGMNEHLRRVIAQSSIRLDPGAIGDAAMTMITEPTVVTYDDPSHPGLTFTLPPAKFIAIDQAGGWVYGLTVNPQLHAGPLAEARAIAEEVERRLATTNWRRDPAVTPRSDTVQVWARSDDAELSMARYTAGDAELMITLKRTGAPTPSERLRGKTSEGFFAEVGITDLSHLGAYQARVLERRRADPAGGSPPLRVSAFMNDTTPP